MSGEGVVNDEERVRALVASLAEPVVVLDSERRLVAASPAAAAALGDAAPGRRVGEDVGGALVLFVGDAARALRLPGAPRRVHRRGLARAPHAARAAARPARERDAPGRRRRRARRAGAAGGRAGARPDRRRPLPRRARDRPRGRLARPHARAARPRRRSPLRTPTAPSTRRSTLDVSGGEEVELPLRPRMLRVVVENLVANAIRYAGPGSTCRISVTNEASCAAPARVSRRRRRRRVAGPRPPVRALLPRRHGAHVARHRARPRDREAHRHLRGRLGRGARRARTRPRDRLPLPARTVGEPLVPPRAPSSSVASCHACWRYGESAVSPPRV